MKGNTTVFIQNILRIIGNNGASTVAISFIRENVNCLRFHYTIRNNAIFLSLSSNNKNHIFLSI